MSETPRKPLSELLADAAAEHASTRNASKEYHFLSMAAQLAGGLETDLRATQAKLAQWEIEAKRQSDINYELKAKLEEAERENQRLTASAAAAHGNFLEAESALARAQGDARRYQAIRNQTGAIRGQGEGYYFALPRWLTGLQVPNLLHGSVAGHLDEAIDAAMSSGGAG